MPRNRGLKETLDHLHNKDLEDLMCLEINATIDYNSAKKCGCGNCRRVSEMSYEDYIDEWHRLMNKHEDHEEMGIVAQALAKLPKDPSAS